MSLSFTSISEPTVSGQETLDPTGILPGTIIVYNLLDENTKAVAQTWPHERYPQVFHPRFIV